jgi:hypothetical protein
MATKNFLPQPFSPQEKKGEILISLEILRSLVIPIHALKIHPFKM